MGVSGEGTQGSRGGSYFFVVGFYVEEDEVGRGIGQIFFKVGVVFNFFGFCVEVVEGFYSFFEELSFNLEGEMDRESGLVQFFEIVDSYRWEGGWQWWGYISGDGGILV